MGACAISLNLGHRLVARRILTRGGRLSSISRMSFMAKLIDVGSIGCYFESLSDPRHTRNRKHLLVDIAVIAVCGILCGCDGPTAIHRWAALQADWLRQHLALANGIPSRDCIRRLLLALKPAAFQRCFQDWITDAIATDDNNPQRLVAIDGKTNRRSHDRAKDLGALHIVSAWASEEGIALGQVATDAKSNEITAILQLLEQINLTDTIITIDAMGCQKDIVAQIVDGGGDCVLERADARTDGLQGWLVRVVECRTQESKQATGFRQEELRRQVSLIEPKREQLLNLRLAGKIADNDFDKKQCELESRERHLGELLQEYAAKKVETRQVSNEATRIFAALRNLWPSATTVVKRRILEIVFQAFTLQGRMLVPSNRTPLELFLAG